MAFSEKMGTERLDSDKGVVRLALQLDDSHMSRAKRVHGGVFFTLLDTAQGGAVISVLPEGRGCATLEMKINFFRPAQYGRVVATGRVVNMSRNTAYTEGELVDGEGKVLAKASGTFFLTATRQQSERERV